MTKNVPAPAPRSLRAALVALGGSLVIAACGGGGNDGVFSDFANTAFAARQAYLKETGR